ncbi:MAG: hypothetical protein ABSG46_19580, partial [Candidatus Binataceae bacterium]
RPFYYIALRLLSGTLPPCLLLIPLMMALPHLELPMRHAIVYQAAMVVAVLLIFSLASAKRDDYILPAIPPLAIMAAASFSPALRLQSPAIIRARRLRDAIAGVIAVVAGLATLAAVILLPAGLHISALNLQSSDASFAAIFISGVTRLEASFLCALAAIMLGAGVCLAGLRMRRERWIAAGIGLSAVAMTLIWTGLLKPREAATRSLRIFAAEVRRQAGAKPIYLPWQDPEFAYYYGSGVPPIPHSIARNTSPISAPIYFVARPAQLAVLNPAVRQRLTPIFRAEVMGGGGPPELYLLNPPG